MQIEREKLLSLLDSVSPGLSPKDTIDQATSFVLKDGRLYTFNDNIACQRAFKFGFTGAIPAGPLLSMLRKWSEDVVKLAIQNGQLVITGKGSRRCTIRVEDKVLLPLEGIEKVRKWQAIPNPVEFAEAIQAVQGCAGTDETKFLSVCVHINPKHVEACDNYHLARRKVVTGLDKSVLIRKDAIENIPPLGMTHIAVTDNWLHFKNEAGLILSCRRFPDQYVDLTKLLNKSGESVTFPKGLVGEVALAEVFTSETPDENLVVVELRPEKGGMVKVTGKGFSGEYSRKLKTTYKGPAVAFRSSPAMLKHIAAKHNECEIATDSIIVKNGSFRYVACLHALEDDKE